MDNSSQPNIGDAVGTTDGYEMIISESATPGTEPLLPSTFDSYVELDIHHAIRLYYQVFITLFGIFANVISLAVTLSKRMRKHSTFVYMSVIGGSDALTLVIAFVWWLGRYVDTTSVWSCKLILFFFYYAIHFSVTLLVAMTAERFVAIRFPFWAHVHLTRRKSVYTIIIIAIAILALDGHNVFTRTMLVDAATGRRMCLFGRLATVDMPHGFFLLYVWQWLDASVYSFFPLSMLGVFNVLIIHTIGGRISKQPKDGGNISTNAVRQSRTEQQITAMLLFVTFAFIALTMPMVVTLILEKSWVPPKDAHSSAIWRLWRTVVSNMMYTHHAINPLLYSLSSHTFRRELIRLLSCCNTKLTDVSHSSTSALPATSSLNGDSGITCTDTYL